MDNATNCGLTSLYMRLQTFSLSPLPNDYKFSNSPLKLAEAGFARPLTKGKDLTDQVECSSCGVKYEGWSGESPLAVHRTLNHKCAFLNTPPPTFSTTSLFSNQKNVSDWIQKHSIYNENCGSEPQAWDETVSPSKANICSALDIQHPFLPKEGGYLMLFESHRLLTFKNIITPDAATYAESGFIYDATSREVICVFCNIRFDNQSINILDLESKHAEKSPRCPFVQLYDVGNIPINAERMIREKVRAKHLNDIRSPKASSLKMKCVIKHPEFEEISARLGTFKTWPKLMAVIFPASIMAEAGFYYSGFMDKVKCYACGVGLFNWTQDAVPVTQHAKASSQCVFLMQTKGKEFIDQAQKEILKVEADYEGASQSQEQDSSLSLESSLSSSSSTAALVPEPSVTSSSASTPVSLGLDLEAIKAAMACQYTQEQIAHAVIKFFNLTSGNYPNTHLLVGLLKAADENYLTLCEKSQEIQESKVKEAAYQQEIQVTRTQLYVKDQEIQATKSELQRTAFELQWRDLEVRTELEQQFVGQIQQQKGIIEQKDQVIERKNQELEQNSIQLQMKDKELEDLQRHIKSLRAELERREQGINGSDDDEDSLSSSDAENSSEPDTSSSEEFPVASCKVCLVQPSQIVFLPCKHLCCCDTCASRLMGQNCPICRERNMGFEKVYVM
ncbi:death-associated inhibitor of apoptosis 2-like isoform X1 [Biomphalaria glabrata]|uniref:Death-associated inhibitor of apoptosis 2-like isoform X1 n=1 Tax=Biomphalaria glabrata TaxID=6526 RepID=A0A9W2ZR62_BIOGL|nr:death-associated inhibitor of apoptosis 2-like isoform X1 [Biomphalaria glabrata]